MPRELISQAAYGRRREISQAAVSKRTTTTVNGRHLSRGKRTAAFRAAIRHRLDAARRAGPAASRRPGRRAQLHLLRPRGARRRGCHGYPDARHPRRSGAGQEPGSDHHQIDNVDGNHVVLDLGGGRYAFYAHLRKGSVAVHPGDRVRRGQVLAKVGNTGNTPHRTCTFTSWTVPRSSGPRASPT